MKPLDGLLVLDLMRTRFPDFIVFQEKAGVLIREFVLAGGYDRKGLVRTLNKLRGLLEHQGCGKVRQN